LICGWIYVWTVGWIFGGICGGKVPIVGIVGIRRSDLGVYLCVILEVIGWINGICDWAVPAGITIDWGLGVIFGFCKIID
jgi:hypothetical protein